MSSQSSVVYWIGRLKAGDRDEATQRLCQAFFSKVIAVARARLAAVPRLRSDAEDVAQSALDSFFRRAAAGKFPRLDDQNDLWALLLTITCRKAARLARREAASDRPTVQTFSELERDARDEHGTLAERIEAPDPDPAEAAAVADGVARLLGVLSEGLREVALLSLDGHTNAEIGTRVGLSAGSITRKLRLIRETWRAEFPDLVPPEDVPEQCP